MKVLERSKPAPEKHVTERIHHVATLPFLDEARRTTIRFTWRDHPNLYYRYKNNGVTGMDASPRADKKASHARSRPKSPSKRSNAALHLTALRLCKTRPQKTPTNQAVLSVCIGKGTAANASQNRVDPPRSAASSASMNYSKRRSGPRTDAPDCASACKQRQPAFGRPTPCFRASTSWPTSQLIALMTTPSRVALPRASSLEEEQPIR